MRHSFMDIIIFIHFPTHQGTTDGEATVQTLNISLPGDSNNQTNIMYTAEFEREKRQAILASHTSYEIVEVLLRKQADVNHCNLNLEVV